MQRRSQKVIPKPEVWIRQENQVNQAWWEDMEEGETNVSRSSLV